MSRNPMQKQKLLYLRKILLEKTDENHGLTSSEILAELALYGITAERKSLYDDFRTGRFGSAGRGLLQGRPLRANP